MSVSRCALTARMQHTIFVHIIMQISGTRMELNCTHATYIYSMHFAHNRHP